MSSPFKGKEFQKLFSKWNEKLVKSGHKEIEHFAHADHSTLKVWDSKFFKGKNPDQMSATTEYYILATRFLENHKFKSARDRRLWELHAQGYEYGEIRKRYKCKLSRSRIHAVIQEIRECMLKSR